MEIVFIGVGVASGLVSVVNAVLARRSMRRGPHSINAAGEVRRRDEPAAPGGDVDWDGAFTPS